MSTAPTRKTQRGYCEVISSGRQFRFGAPHTVVEAHTVEEVWPALQRVSAFVDAGNVAVGYVAYEAAAAFDTALQTHPPEGRPLLWFAIHDALPEPEAERDLSTGNADTGPWEPRVSEPAYNGALKNIRAWIAAGDTYQVNYTFPLTADFRDDAYNLFLQLRQSQSNADAIYLDCGPLAVASASPELFFHLDGHNLTTRPMKGTAARGLWPEADALAAERLVRSPKERAENVMIVDLLRNDMGRVCKPGSVCVEQLCAAERYDTLWQMTSTITGETSADVPDIFRALFPSGSVTGAPKVRTMQIIRELEPHPRGVYCGAIGWWGPNRQARFHVAIRTVTIDREKHTATYSIGSGITWDSLPHAEYAECRLKAAILATQPRTFDLLETLRWNGDSYDLLPEHLRRLAASAEYFRFAVDMAAIEKELNRFGARFHGKPRKVRLLVSRRGNTFLEASKLEVWEPRKLSLAPSPVDAADVFLYHKTTQRAVYEDARAACKDCDEVLLWNERRELTETTIANLVVERAGRLVTPPIRCGLLPGTLRARLLAEEAIQEEVVRLEDLPHVTRFWLINGVRGWVPVPVSALPTAPTLTSTQ